MKLALYLAYCVLWDLGIVFGCGYIVFWKGHSPWWFLAAIAISSLGGFSTDTFRALAELPPKKEKA